jgi:hypothetical protein
MAGLRPRLCCVIFGGKLVTVQKPRPTAITFRSVDDYVLSLNSPFLCIIGEATITTYDRSFGATLISRWASQEIRHGREIKSLIAAF